MLRLVLQLHGYSSSYVSSGSGSESGIPDGKGSPAHASCDSDGSGIIRVSSGQHNNRVFCSGSPLRVGNAPSISQASRIQGTSDAFNSVHGPADSHDSSSFTDSQSIEATKLHGGDNKSVHQSGTGYVPESTLPSGYGVGSNESYKSSYGSPGSNWTNGSGIPHGPNLQHITTTSSSTAHSRIIQPSDIHGSEAPSGGEVPSGDKSISPTSTLNKSSLYLPRRIIVVKSAGSPGSPGSFSTGYPDSGSSQSLGSSSGSSSGSSGSSGYFSFNSGLISSGTAVQRVMSSVQVNVFLACQCHCVVS